MKFVLTIATLILFFTGVMAQNPPEHRTSFVVDVAKVLSAEEQTTLDKRLKKFNKTSPIELTIVTVVSLNNYTPSQYAQLLAGKWKIGKEGKDNGVLILIKPKTENEKNRIAMVVAGGAQSFVTDEMTSQVMQKGISPGAKEGQFYAGFNKAIDMLMELSNK